MIRYVFGVVLVVMLAVAWQPLLADQNDGQRNNSNGTQASANDQQQPSGGTSATDKNVGHTESGPALPAPDGSTSKATRSQNQQDRSASANNDRRVQTHTDAEQPSSERGRNDAREGRREDARDLRDESGDRVEARRYRRDDYRDRGDSPERGRERSYLPRDRRELPVYFGAEFDPQTDGVALVTRVDQGSPADRAGLRRDDMVISLNGEKVSSADEAISVLGSMRAGDRVDVEYSRQARGRAVLADSRESAVASRSSEDRVTVDRPYGDSRRGEYGTRNDSSRNDSSRDRPRTERRGLGILPRWR